MRKKQPIYRVVSMFVFILVSVLPLTTFAQITEGLSPWTNNQIRSWHNSSNTQISQLDSTRVENIPLPILFGLTPDNLSPNFGDPRSGGRTHEGLDIMAPKRALVVSPTQAVVVRVGVGDSAGNYVYTANPGSETFAYMHLDEIANIHEGDTLEKGALIGYVGNTGNASGGATHLHFEVRFNGEATDPFPRIRSIFPVADKIRYLGIILGNSSDEKVLAENIVAMYRKDLLFAESLNISLPVSIQNALTSKTVVTASASAITRNLKVGSQGDDVAALQTALGILADGIFGPMTKAAVVKFQISKGLTADGVFGPVSILAMAGTSGTYPSGCTSLTKFSPTTGVKCVVTL